MSGLEGLLEILACPRCKGALTLAGEDLLRTIRQRWEVDVKAQAPAGSAHTGELQGGFVCGQCRLFYPVVDGIPDLVVEDALPLPEPAGDA